MKLFSKVAMATALSCTMASGAMAAKQVNVYNWSDYIDEATVPNFEKETGIKVTYDVFDSNEVLEAKILAGQSGYDVVAPTNSFMAKQIKAGAYQKLDKSKIPNLKNLDPGIMKNLEAYDAGNEYSVPYLWGTTGIGYNIGKVKEILGEDAPTNSWDLVFDPKYVSKLKQCGVAMLDTGSEILPLMLHYMGKNPNSKDPKDYKAAKEKIMELREHVTYFHSSRYITDLANGDICVAIGWSGDVFQAAARAEEAENGHEITYVIPKEGTGIWSDMLVIPADAKNVDEAHEFINYVLDAKVGAQITNYVWFTSPNTAATPYIDKEILEHPGITPSKDTHLFSFEVMPTKIDRLVNRLWTSIRSGK